MVGVEKLFTAVQTKIMSLKQLPVCYLIVSLIPF